MSPKFAVLAIACAGTMAHAQVARRDSAGISIATVKLAAPTGALRLSAKPSLDLGGSGDAAQEFSTIAGVVRLSNGTLVVADGTSKQLRYFDARGAHVRTSGGRGSGPGEFGRMHRLLAFRDTVIADDEEHHRVSLFTSAGRHVRTTAITPPKGRRGPTIVDVLGDGTMLATSSDIVTAPARPAPYYFMQRLYAYRADGRPVGDIGHFGDGEHFVQARPAPKGGVAGVSYWNRAFGRQTTIAAGSAHFLVGDGTTFELRFHDKTGALQRIVRADERPVPLPAADREAYRQSSLRGVQPQDLENARRRIDEMPYPATLPAFRRFVVGRDDRVWVQRYLTTAAPERWIVLESDGRFVDEVTLPARFRLFEAGAGYLLGVGKDSDDVEHVQMWTTGAGR